MPRSETQQRWYPTKQQIATDPEKVIRQVLAQHYALQDAHNALLAKVNGPSAQEASSSGGPTDTRICGLLVAPIDVKSLADGTKLTYVKAQGQFVFK